MQLSTTLFFSFFFSKKHSKKRKPKPHQIKKKETQKKKKKTQWQVEGSQKLKSLWKKGEKTRLQHTKLLDI
jgi:hypothetical protein